MKTRFQVPRILQSYCDDQMELAIGGETVGQLLDQVKRQYPALHGCICDERGNLRQHINLFLNNDLLDRNRFDIRLESGVVVSVFQAVSGG